MDANTLKEIDIVQFGKRVKIANAINELRRPGSMRSFGHGSSRSQQMSPAYNSHHRVPSITAAYPVSPNYGPDYQQSSQPPQHSRSASVSGIVDTIPEDEAYNPQQRETAALGFNEVSCRCLAHMPILTLSSPPLLLPSSRQRTIPSGVLPASRV